MRRNATNPEDRPVATPRHRRRRGSGTRGFVLVAMIWSLGLIIVLASFGIVGSRFRERTTADIVAEAKTAAAANTGMSLGIARALLQEPTMGSTPPWHCVLPGGQHLSIAIADEVGKIDLNAAPVALLTALFSNLTQNRDAGAQIAADIAVFRTAVRDPGGDALMRRYVLDSKPEGPKRGPFVTTLELDQVVGVSHALFEAALPFVTVRAQRPDVDFFHATPAMLRLFGIRDAGATAPKSQGAREVTITVDATASDGGRFVREALVSLGSANSGGVQDPYTIHEWRRADRGVATSDGIGDDDPEEERPCFSGDRDATEAASSVHPRS